MEPIPASPGKAGSPWTSSWQGSYLETNNQSNHYSFLSPETPELLSVLATKDAFYMELNGRG